MAAKVSEAYPEPAYVQTLPVSHPRVSILFRVVRVPRVGAAATHGRDPWLNIQQGLVG